MVPYIFIRSHSLDGILHNTVFNCPLQKNKQQYNSLNIILSALKTARQYDSFLKTVGYNLRTYVSLAIEDPVWHQLGLPVRGRLKWTQPFPEQGSPSRLVQPAARPVPLLLHGALHSLHSGSR